jgi:methionyl-tRNA formyltransferase
MSIQRERRNEPRAPTPGSERNATTRIPSSSMTPLHIIFAGAGEFGRPTLTALLTSGHQVVQVFSQPDRPAGRGRKLAPTPISQFAVENCLPLARTDDINRESLPPADLMIVIAFGQKISEAVANHARFGSVNLHASRLPKYRGAAPINWAILNGETETGNSVIRLAQRMDAGAILGMSSIKIGDLETAGELHDRLAEDGAPLMLDVIAKLASGAATEIVQNESQATKAPKLTRDSARIDWNKPAEFIARQTRGMYPWPGCRVRLLDASGKELDRLTLVRATPRITGVPPVPAGEITATHTVSTSDGDLEILELQPEAKRPMPLAAYRNGHPWQPGMRLESIT